MMHQLQTFQSTVNHDAQRRGTKAGASLPSKGTPVTSSRKKQESKLGVTARASPCPVAGSCSGLETGKRLCNSQFSDCYLEEWPRGNPGSDSESRGGRCHLFRDWCRTSALLRVQCRDGVQVVGMPDVCGRVWRRVRRGGRIR